MKGKIGIITVLYKSESVLPEFFQSLEQQTYKNFVLYVIDNKSPDNSLALSEEFKTKSLFETVVIANADNYGVAKGNNIGIKQALADNCDYVLLSNNDVTFGAETIANLLNETLKFNADMSVPKIYFHGTNLIWLAGGYFVKRNGWSRHIGYLEQDNGQYNTAQRTDYAPTCFMLIRKNVFDQIGMMDEMYFVYWDDTDFVYRALNAGKLLWYFPSSVVNHKESTSTGILSDFSIYYKYRNFVYFTIKNRHTIYATYILLGNLFIHIFKNTLIWNYKQWKIAFKAMIDGLKMSI